MNLIKRIIRKALQISTKKDNPRRIYFGPLKGYKWIYNSGYSGYWMGTYELEIVNKYISKLKTSSVVYDLGAHIGYYTLIASKFLKGRGNVYSFEPFPMNFAKLTNHIRINNLKNVIPIQKAVGNQNGKVQFSNSPNDSANTYIKGSFMYKSFDHIEVDAITIDSVVHGKDLIPPNLIKIDVEGAELDVLKGAENTITKYHPTILLSTHNCQNEGIHKQCLDYLASLGYTYEYFNVHKKETELDDPWYDLIAEFK